MDNKGEKILSVYWFAILFIVAAGIVYVVASFYGQPYDVREIEADILTDKIAECISSQGVLEGFVFQSNFENNFMEICNLNFEVEDNYNWEDEGQYYVELEINNFVSGENFLDLQKGNSNLKDFCFAEGRNLPYCLNKSFYSLDESGNQYQINLLSVVRKTEKNAN